MKKCIIYSMCFGMFLSSCNAWLDVKPQGQTEEEDMYTTYEGFKSALIGCYMRLNDRSLYGENLTMSCIESMAQLWDLSSSTRYTDVALAKYDYASSYAKNALSDMYGGLYNVIVQANSILGHLEKNGSCISDSVACRVVRGEAYAIRAFCHLDILRLFGQMPKNPVKKVSLPYAEKVSIKDLPPYYDYHAFCKKLEQDLLAAEEELKAVDPVIDFGMTSSGNRDNFLNDRGLRMNYYAVKALQARFYLYTGQTGSAYAAAKEVYDSRPVELSTVQDLAMSYYAAPSECLFALGNHELIDYSIKVLGMGSEVIASDHLFITFDMQNDLYRGVDVGTHAGYGQLWNTSTMDGSGGYSKALLKKYYYDAKAEYPSDVLMTKLQVLPVLRMSEVCLILMETTADLEEANALYVEYMRARSVNAAPDFRSLAEVRNFVLEEIRREFYAEGHMFYAYKRLGTRRMLWGAKDMGEAEYILPLPDSEYDPGNMDKESSK